MSTWSLRISSNFEKALRKLDRSVILQIKDHLESIVELPNPRVRGKALTGELTGFWRYRVGAYRIVVEFRQSELVVIAIDVAHRSEIYKR